MFRDVTFQSAIPLAFQTYLERQLFYVSDDIDDFSLVVSARGIDGVRVLVGRPGADVDAVEARVRSAAQRYLFWRPRIKPERIWTRETKSTLPTDTFDQMRDRGMVYQSAPGLVALDESFVRLADYLDATITAMVKRVFGAVEYRYPTLIPSAVMKRGGYLQSFPHLLMFVTRLHSDFDVYTAASGASSEDKLADLLRQQKDTELCLPPTMCYHTYAQIANSTLPRAGQVFTAKGKSFRFESKYQQNLERLYDFTIREIVFVGAGGAVSRQRGDLLREFCNLTDSWELTGFCETANDPFFAEDDGKNSSLAQRLMALKYEMRLDVGNGRTIAVASFNRHLDYLGKAYDITLPDGSTAQTACAGVGLERLAFAFFCQHGLEEAGWPEEVRNALAQRRTFEEQFLSKPTTLVSMSEAS
jgi:hypothetical protein